MAKKSNQYKYSFKIYENGKINAKDSDFSTLYEIKSINGDTYYYTVEDAYRSCFGELQRVLEDEELKELYPDIFTDIGEMKMQEFIMAYGLNTNGFMGGLIAGSEDSYEEINISDIDSDYIIRTIML